VPRKKLQPVDPQDARTIGGLLRDLRRASGIRSAQEAASLPDCPAARQTIYAYERGGLVPSLAQFLELVEFYALEPRGESDPKAADDLRAQGVAAVMRALWLPAYHVRDAMDLVARLQPTPGRGRRR
jgi:hypothetical protein